MIFSSPPRHTVRGIVAIAVLVPVLLGGCSLGTSFASPSRESMPPSAPVDTGLPSATASPTPTPEPIDPVQEYADARLATMTLQQKIASMFMLHVPGTDPAVIRSFVDRYQPGGLILMGDNVPSPPEGLSTLVPLLSSDSGLPLLVGIDQEGGIVRRIPTDTAPSARELRPEVPFATEESFSARADLLARLGVSINFGIVADQTADTSSFIYSRVLGTTPRDAADRVAAAVTGEKGTVLSTLKHFPGHGAAPGDSHSSIPASAISLDEWRATHAVPFAAGITAGAELVMTGHLRFSAVDELPASLSPRWNSILREELGFAGIVITDDMRMLQDSGEPQFADAAANTVAAIAAGNTMVMYVLPADPASIGADPQHLVDAVAAAVADGRVAEATITAAARQLLVERRRLSGQTTPFSG